MVVAAPRGHAQRAVCLAQMQRAGRLIGDRADSRQRQAEPMGERIERLVANGGIGGDDQVEELA